MLNECERDATGLPAEIPLEEAAVRALFLQEERIPELREMIVMSQGGDIQAPQDQRELCHRYRQHFVAWDVKSQISKRLAETSTATGDAAESFLRSIAEEEK